MGDRQDIQNGQLDSTLVWVAILRQLGMFLLIHSVIRIALINEVVWFTPPLTILPACGLVPLRLFALTLSFNPEPELAELEVCCCLGYALSPCCPLQPVHLSHEHGSWSRAILGQPSLCTTRHSRLDNPQTPEQQSNAYRHMLPVVCAWSSQ